GLPGPDPSSAELPAGPERLATIRFRIVSHAWLLFGLEPGLRQRRDRPARPVWRAAARVGIAVRADLPGGRRDLSERRRFSPPPRPANGGHLPVWRLLRQAGRLQAAASLPRLVAWLGSARQRLLGPVDQQNSRPLEQAAALRWPYRQLCLERLRPAARAEFGLLAG